MAHEVAVVLLVVVGDDLPTATAQLRDLRGRELAGVPGSWVSRVAVHTDLDVLRDRLRTPAAAPDGGDVDGALDGDTSEVDTGGDPDDPEREFDAPDLSDDPLRPFR